MRDFPQLRILVLGAGYGLLFAVRAALGGHHITIVCRPGEAEVLNAEGPVIDLPARKTGIRMQISRQNASLDIVAVSPNSVDPGAYDLVVLAMQETHFRDPEISNLSLKIAGNEQPVVSIMNMALPPFLKRLPGVWHDDLSEFYHAPDLWAEFSPSAFTHSSPDPQAIRPDPSRKNYVKVTLDSNFKIAPFAQPKHSKMLRSLCRSANLAASLHNSLSRPRVQLLPVRSEFTPLAKWPMLMTGNYRCITDGTPMSIAETIADDSITSRRLYECTRHLCTVLGADVDALVTYEAYVKAASQLSSPSSVALALEHGRTRIERMDKVIQFLHLASGLPNPDLDRIVVTIDNRLV